MNPDISISVIVPAYNAEKTISQCLRSIRSALPRDGELIVVDDASQDNTPAIAVQYTDKVVRTPERSGPSKARNLGKKHSSGKFLVFIDADVRIPSGSIKKMTGFFESHPEADAVTGCLSKEHPNLDFFSQFKNLYMHYSFKKLPGKIDFIYGSIFAVRKEAFQEMDESLYYGEDTALGQALFSQGKKIVLLKDLEVTHLKTYDLFSIIRNDFKIPFFWARQFIRSQGWRQVGKRDTAYAHASYAQISSISLAVLSFCLFWPAWIKPGIGIFAAVCLTGWTTVNVPFFYFLFKERGILFGLKALLWHFSDQLIMSTGILIGFLKEIFFPGGARRK